MEILASRALKFNKTRKPFKNSIFYCECYSLPTNLTPTRTLGAETKFCVFDNCTGIAINSVSTTIILTINILKSYSYVNL